MEEMRLKVDDWPRQGRVGRATAGDYAGDYVFVFPDIEGRWGFYTSSGVDDMLPDLEYLKWRLESAKVEWLDAPDDERVEREIFAMRPLTSQFESEPSRWSWPPRLWFKSWRRPK